MGFTHAQTALSDAPNLPPLDPWTSHLAPTETALVTQHTGTAQTGPSSTQGAASAPSEPGPAGPGDVLGSDDAVDASDAVASDDAVATVDAVDGWGDARLVGQLFSLAVGTHSARGITVDDVVEPDGPDDSDHAVVGRTPATDGVRRTPVDALVDVVAARHVGGVCYFPETAEGDSPDAIRHLVRRLQQVASVPLLVSADQENGTVSRLRQGSTRLPSAQALAAADDVVLTEEVARTSGTELRATGIRHAFAPVADLAVEPRNPVIGVRSPGADPQAAARQVSATVRGLAAAGVASTLKHFPGHGSTTVDSHLGLPVLGLTRDAWERQERAVFAAGIAAGADAVMIGHLVFPAVDAQGPATYSRAVVTGELREALGFDGVIVTDALDMAGAQLADGPGAGAVAALAAGVDQLLMPGDPEAAIDAVLAALADGVLSRDALRDSARRILRLKERLGLTGDGIDVEAPLATPQHASTAERAARTSLVWRDPSTTWVLAPGAAGTRVLVVGLRTDPQLRGVDVSAVLADRLGAAGAQVWTESLDDDPDRIVAAATQGFGGATPDVLVVATRDAWRDPEQSRHLARLLALATETGAQVCVVATRSPSDSALVPDGVPLLLTFGDVAPSARAAGGALAGAAAVTGVLPVDLVGADGQVVPRHTSPATPPHPSEETRS